MKDLIDIGAYGKYGFYDAIDYTKERIEQDKYKVVKGPTKIQKRYMNKVDNKGNDYTEISTLEYPDYIDLL